MAARGTKKYISVEQEEEIARRYDGKRSASSGAAGHDAGDVRTSRCLFECKYQGAPGEPLHPNPRKVLNERPYPKLLKEFEKVGIEAWAEGREPVMALAYYAPDSPLANWAGWVQLTVRLMGDDIQRNEGTT